MPAAGAVDEQANHFRSAVAIEIMDGDRSRAIGLVSLGSDPPKRLSLLRECAEEGRFHAAIHGSENKQVGLAVVVQVAESNIAAEAHGLAGAIGEHALQFQWNIDLAMEQGFAVFRGVNAAEEHGRQEQRRRGDRSELREGPTAETGRHCRP